MAALTGVRVLLGADEAALAAEIEQLGGSVALAGSASLQPPDVALAAGVMAPAYAEARDRFPSIPRVGPAWLAASREAGARADVEAHRLRAFAGLEVSVSGGQGGEKARAAELVCAGGGVYTANMTRSCTHLVILGARGATRAVSTKELHARMWETVAIVWGEWLQDNARAGEFRGNEAAFAVPAAPPAAAPRPPPRAPAAAQRDALQAVQPATSAAAPAASETSLPTIGTRIGDRREKAPVAAPAHPQPPQQQQPPPTSRPGALESLPATLGATLPHSAPLPLPDLAAAPRQGERFEAQTPAADCDDERDYLFLADAVVHLACCTPAEHLEALRALREGAGTRRPDLRDDVTHVVVGSDLTRAEVGAVAQHLRAHGHQCALAGLDWLRACLAARRQVPVAGGLELRATGLLDAVTRAAREAEARQEAAAAAAAAMAAAGEAAPSQRRAGGGSLEGRFFLLTPLLEASDREYAQRRIRDAGGRLFDRLSLRAVPSTAAAFAVCPLSMPHADASSLKDDPAFCKVPEEHRVTVVWLDACADRGQLLLPVPASWEFLLCRPLPHRLPLPGMEHVVATASLYGEREKGWVKQVVKALGGKYTNKMSARNTHLVVRCAAGPKFCGAAARCVAPVTLEWLAQMATAGKHLPEVHFYPPPPADGENTEGTQMPFEASLQPKATQTAGAGGGVAGTQARRAMALSSQQNLGAGGSQQQRAAPPGPSQPRVSAVESLFSQLTSPAKPLRQPPSKRRGPLPPRPVPPRPVQALPKAGGSGLREESGSGSLLGALPEASLEGDASAAPAAEEDDDDPDMDEHLLRLQGALAAQAARPHLAPQDSQADPVEPVGRARRLAGELRPSGRGGGAKRARPAASSGASSHQSGEPELPESSQQVGYDESVASRPPPPPRGARGSRGAEETRRLIERLQAAGGAPPRDQDAMLGD